MVPISPTAAYDTKYKMLPLTEVHEDHSDNPLSQIMEEQKEAKPRAYFALLQITDVAQQHSIPYDEHYSLTTRDVTGDQKHLTLCLNARHNRTDPGWLTPESRPSLALKKLQLQQPTWPVVAA